MKQRAAHKSNYTVIDNGIWRDPSISILAKGLMGIILSEKDDAPISVEKMASRFKEGKAAIRRAFNELRDAGYMVTWRESFTGPNGRLQHRTVNDIFEVPAHANRKGGNGIDSQSYRAPGTRSPETRTTSSSSTKTTSTKTTSTKDLKTLPPTSWGPRIGAAVSGKQKTSMTLADHLIDDCLKRARTDYGAQMYGSVDRRKLAAAITRVRNSYGLSDIQMEELMEIYIQTPQKWNRTAKHPAWDFVTANTIVRLRNQLDNSGVPEPVSIEPQPVGSANRKLEAYKAAQMDEGARNA